MAFRAKAKPVVQSWQGVPVWTARFRVAALIVVQAAVKVDVKACFHAVEPIHAVAAKGVRYVMEPIRAAAKIRVVRPDVTVVDRIGEAIHHAMVPIPWVRTGEAIRCAMDDQLPGLAKSEANQPNRAPNHVMDCCARFPASCASEVEPARLFGIRCRAQGGRSELSGRPELGSAAQRWRPRYESERHDQFPVERHVPDASRLNQSLRLCPERRRDPKPELADVR